MEQSHFDPSDIIPICLIGSGRYGTVLAATLRTSPQVFALKIVDKSLTVKRKRVDSVLRERLILSACSDSTFTTQLHCAFTDAHSLYFLLDYCPGGDLFRMISQRKKALPENNIRFYAASLVLALSYLHDHHIIFADLKPENILIDAKGYLKLADFGCSHFSTSFESNHEDYDNSSAVYGTPGYCSPEMMRHERFSYAADVWALGCVVYEMASGGVLPFNDRNPKLLAYKIENNAVSFDEPAMQNLSDNCKDFICQLLQKKADSRLGSEGQLSLKQHPWFKNFNWDSLSKGIMPAPIVPKIKSLVTDFSNFDDAFTEKDCRKYVINKEIRKEQSQQDLQQLLPQTDPFRDFPFNRDVNVHVTMTSNLKESTPN